jgi:hypothetical protein
MAYTNIDDPSAHFQTALYAGNNTTDHNITNDGNSDLQPDLVWIKQRTSNNPHTLQDTSRGFAGNGEINLLQSASEAAELTNGAFESFNTNGFGVGGTNVASGAYNLSGSNYVAWQWKANGGTTASNTDGSITSTVQANQDAGFSIVTYAGTGVYNQTVGHGLGVAPAVVILKNRTTGEASYDDWWVYHQNLSNPVNRALRLNESGAEQSSTVFWSVVPSSTIFGVGGSVDAPRYTNGASQNYVAYCFAEKQGYSKFDSYVGNGVANNGPFVYLGFKPRFIMIKSITATGSHVMWDSKRSPFNGMDDYLVAAEADAEGTNGIFTIDAVSNGFKIRNTGANNGLNQSGTKYLYYAFAENPFTTSTGVPTTAR